MLLVRAVLRAGCVVEKTKGYTAALRFPCRMQRLFGSMSRHACTTRARRRVSARMRVGARQRALGSDTRRMLWGLRSPCMMLLACMQCSASATSSAVSSMQRSGVMSRPSFRSGSCCEKCCAPRCVLLRQSASDPAHRLAAIGLALHALHKLDSLYSSTRMTCCVACAVCDGARQLPQSMHSMY